MIKRIMLKRFIFFIFIVIVMALINRVFGRVPLTMDTIKTIVFFSTLIAITPLSILRGMLGALFGNCGGLFGGSNNIKTQEWRVEDTKGSKTPNVVFTDYDVIVTTMKKSGRDWEIHWAERSHLNVQESFKVSESSGGGFTGGREYKVFWN